MALYHGTTPLKIIGSISLLVDNEMARQTYVNYPLSNIKTLVKRDDKKEHKMTGNNHPLAKNNNTR
jgi:hypothetical protein